MVELDNVEDSPPLFSPDTDWDHHMPIASMHSQVRGLHNGLRFTVMSPLPL